MALTPFSQFIQKKKRPQEAEDVRIVNFKDFLGGGSYTVGPNKNKVYGLPRAYGGVDTQPGKQRDHIFPVSLGGTSQSNNIRLTSTNPVDTEISSFNDYLKGKLTLPQARLKVITEKQNQNRVFGINEKEDTNTAKNFFKALPGAAKRVGKTVLDTELKLFKGVKDARQNLINSAAGNLKTYNQTLKDRNQRLATGQLTEKDFTDYVNDVVGVSSIGIKNVNKIPLPKSITALGTKFRQFLKPIKNTEPETQHIFSKWVRARLVGRELANQEAKTLKVPGKAGLDTMLKYEKGQDTSFSQPIKQAFDRLFNEAEKRGLNIGYKENYLPQVYKNTAQEVKTAVGKFLKDQGLDQQYIDDYLEGVKDLPENLSRMLKLNPSFSKQRVFPNYATAMKYGLTPKYSNPAQLLAHYRDDLEKTTANTQFINELLETGKLKTADLAPRAWKAVELPFSNKGYYAEPKLADTLNGLFRDENSLTFTQSAVKLVAGASKKAQEITLSAGVPKTSVNFFAIGQLVKQVTAGDLKAIPAFVRANSLRATAKFFSENQGYLRRMANQGLDLGNRIGNYQDIYKNLAQPSLRTEVAQSSGVVAKAKTVGSWFKQHLGQGFDKAFNEKTFASFMPQLYTQTFKDAYKKAIAKGMVDAQAEKLAGDVTKAFFGLYEDLGRSQTTKDALSAVFFAPQFREGIINTLFNTAKSVTSEVRNPAFYKNRRLLGGMLLSYAGYNALNKKLNDKYMWENEPGREFALRIPVGDTVMYVEFMPSFLAFARNIASGGIATAKGDFKTAGQKFGSVFSMPIKITSEVLSNKDYFGNPIYKETDDTQTKLEKIAVYVGLTVNHPFVKELVKQTITEPDKPLYQSVITGMELPLKFTTKDKIAQQEFYRAMDEQQAARAKQLDDFRPTFTKIRQLVSEGNKSDAQNLLNGLSKEDYELYKSLLTSEKRNKTIQGQIEIKPIFDRIQELKNQGNQEEAQRILNSLSEHEYRYYQLLLKKQP